MRRSSTLVAALLLLAGAAWFGPRLLHARLLSFGTPVPQPFAQVTLFQVRPGTSACLDSVAVDTGHQAALFGVDTAGRPGPRLSFSLRGWSPARAELRAGYGSGQVTIPFAGPPRSIITRACIRDLGRRPVSLVGTMEPRVLSRPRLSIDGRLREGEVSLAFESAKPARPTTVAAKIVRRITAFKPVWVQAWLVAVLLAAIIVGAIAAPLLALWRAHPPDA